MKYKNSNTLLICTGHQDNEKKVEYALQHLKKIKSDGCDICFVTHVPNGLSEISEICDYVIYDKNNSYCSESTVIENLYNVPIESLNNVIQTSYFINNTKLISSFHSNHTKALLISIKNGMKLAKQKGYDWICTMEYDSMITKINLHDYLVSKTFTLDKLGKLAYVYHTEDFRGGFLLYPHMLLYNISLLEKTDFFNIPWENNDLEYSKLFGNRCAEQLLREIIQPFQEQCVIRSAWEINSDFRYNLEDLLTNNKFHLEDSKIFNSQSYYGKVLDVNFYCESTENGYNMPLCITASIHANGYKVKNISVLFKGSNEDARQVLAIKDPIELSHNAWFTFNTIENYQVTGEDDKLILSYVIVEPSGKESEHSHFVPLSQLDKYLYIKKLEKING
jgi:hypothetical protein